MKNVINYFLLMLIVNTTSAQWVQQNSTTTKNLKEVKFVSESTGYIVGDDGVVLKTTNEGSQWDQLETGVADNLTALWLVSSENVFIGTSTGIVLKTIDGGLNWETLNISTDYIYDISFINNNIGFIGTMKFSKVLYQVRRYMKFVLPQT